MGPTERIWAPTIEFFPSGCPVGITESTLGLLYLSNAMSLVVFKLGSKLQVDGCSSKKGKFKLAILSTALYIIFI
jgi:hypothetical protein